MRELASVFIAIFCVSSVAYGQETYTDLNEHYSFTVPSGWEKLTNQQIEQFKKENPDTDYSGLKGKAVFQLIENMEDLLKMPFFTAGKLNKDEELYIASRKLLSMDDEILLRAGILLSTRDANSITNLLSTNSNKTILNKERQAVITGQNYKSEYGDQFVVTVALFGKDTATTFSFITLTADFYKWFPAFYSAVDSFSYDSGYTHKVESYQEPSEAKDEDRILASLQKRDMEIIAEYFKKFISSILVLGLAVFIFRRKRKMDIAHQIKNKVVLTQTKNDHACNVPSGASEMQSQINSLLHKAVIFMLLPLFFVGPLLAVRNSVKVKKMIVGNLNVSLSGKKGANWCIGLSIFSLFISFSFFSYIIIGLVANN